MSIAEQVLAPLALGPAASFELRHWLTTQIEHDRYNLVKQLFERVHAARHGGPRIFHVWGNVVPGSRELIDAPDWIVRVANEDAVVRTLPFGEAWLLRVDELLGLLLRWFDAVAPDVAAKLRDVLALPSSSPAPAKTAGTILAGLLCISVPSVSAVANALESRLSLVKISEPNYEYESRFESGPFRRAVLWHNVKSNAATLSLSARFASVRDIDVRQIGVTAEFAGFNFDLPQGPRALYRIDLGSSEVRLIDPADHSASPLVAIDWLAAKRDAPFAVCNSRPARIDRLTSASSKVPGRFWIEVTFDGQDWIATPPLEMRAQTATRIEFHNLAEFPGLHEHRSALLQFVIEVYARESRQLAGSNVVRETLHARIIRACVAGAPHD